MNIPLDLDNLRIAFIGAGRMGGAIMVNLFKHGLRADYLDHPGNQPTARLQALGARPVARADDLVAGAEVVFLCVTGAPEVKDVMFRDEGVLAGLERGATVIDLSTSLPDVSAEVDQSVRAQGARYMDAAMTRTPKEAEEGRLNLIVGADPDDFARIRPVLETFAENIVHAGPVTSGHRLKLVHNFVSLGNAALLAEAVALASMSGVDPRVFCAVLEDGGGGSTALKRLKPYILEGDDRGLQFTVANAHKDLTYYLEMAETGDQHHNAVALGVQELLRYAKSQNFGDVTLPRLIDLLRGAG